MTIRRKPAAPKAKRAPISFTPFTREDWIASDAHREWAGAQLGGSLPYFRDIVAVLQNTRVKRSPHGAEYDLGKAHGLDLAVQIILSLAPPEAPVEALPDATYGAEALLEEEFGSLPQ